MPGYHKRMAPAVVPFDAARPKPHSMLGNGGRSPAPAATGRSHGTVEAEIANSPCFLNYPALGGGLGRHSVLASSQAHPPGHVRVFLTTLSFAVRTPQTPV